MYFPRLDNHMTIGASGVAFAYFGAMIGLALFSKDSYFMLILQGYLYIIIINLLFTFLMPGISKTGHIGGLIGGYLFTFILYLVGLLK
jgi:rhomboid protease GluP